MTATAQKPATRAECVLEAQRLRGNGLLLREIAERMGVAIQTVDTWLSDPDLSKQWARRINYAQPCSSCGELMDGSNGYANTRQLCQSCREWPEDAIIDAIQRWADEHGGIPPSSTEWRHGAVDHPSANVVCRRIGWNEALLRAGFALRCDRRPETQEWVEAQVLAGIPIGEIGRQIGVSEAAIRRRFRDRGTTIAEFRRTHAPLKAAA